jgi:Flp pilus assembly secretin CpaC
MCVAPGLVTVALGVLVSATWAAEPAKSALYLAVDKGQLLAAGPEILSKVVVVNPNIADVRVLSPTQLLLMGKAAGTTSLVLVYPTRVQEYDVAVQPNALAATAPIPSQAEPHSVLVQRGERVTQSIFVRDRDRQWVEISPVKVEPEPAKK